MRPDFGGFVKSKRDAIVVVVVIAAAAVVIVIVVVVPTCYQLKVVSVGWKDEEERRYPGMNICCFERRNNNMK